MILSIFYNILTKIMESSSNNSGGGGYCCGGGSSSKKKSKSDGLAVKQGYQGNNASAGMSDPYSITTS